MASSSSTTQKKRKRDAADDGDDRITLKISGSESAGRLGPVLVSYPALSPDKDTTFQCYYRKKPSKDKAKEELSAKNSFIAGEADSVEFVSTAESETASAGSRYLVGIYNKRTKTTILRPAPLHILGRQVKALKGIQPAAVSALERLQARNALGETFGTKKALAAIRANERNKVDVSAMESAVGRIQDTVAANTASLPTLEEAKEAADSARLIPAYNAETHDPAEVYPIDNIIPETEWKSISTGSITSASSHQDRLKRLPFSRSSWIEQHLKALYPEEKTSPNKKKLKLLISVSSMMAFYFADTNRKKDKAEAQEKLSRIPGSLFDGLFSRFTETARGSTKPHTTSTTETLLLTNMFALMLRLDNWATDTALVAHDLSMTVTKVNTLFKSLGCKIDKLKPGKFARHGITPPASGGSDIKRAILVAPVEFPKPKTGKKRGGGGR